MTKNIENGILNQVQNDKKSGFTLAEVLITLGIIGVVAAMTIPTLIANTNSSKFASQFKKTLSQLSQASLMSQSQWDTNYATLDNVDNSNATGNCTEGHDISKGDNTICGLFNSTLSGVNMIGGTNSTWGNYKSNGHAYSVKISTVTADGIKGAKPAATGPTAWANLNKFVGFQLADGSLVVVPKTLKDCTIEGQLADTDLSTGNLKNCLGFIDVNGAALPNKEVTCKTVGDTDLTPTKVCQVPKDPKNMTDIFPVVFHDQAVEPATNAAKAILNGANKQ